jgi:hypothetical protein
VLIKMIKKRVITKVSIVFLFLIFGFMLISPLASAGVGLSWNQQSSLVPENTKTCLTYKVYNPWPTDSYIEIQLSDELMEIVSYFDTDVTFVPKETSSSEAIPVEFCFKTPRVYEKDCWIGNSLICKQECTQDMKVYSGEVEVMEASSSDLTGAGAGGSATAMAVSAPLAVKVQCVPHSRNYTLIYLVIAIIAGILLIMNLLRKKKKKK